MSNPETALPLNQHNPSSQRVSLFDFPVDLITMEQALNAIKKSLLPNASNESQTFHVVTLNPEMIMQGEQNASLGQTLKQADLIIPDGAGLVWALKLNGHQVKRLPGIELSEQVLAWAAQSSQPVAVIGTKQDVLEAAIARLKYKYPGLSIVYARNGFFNDDAEMSTAIEDCVLSRPAIVLVAMGVPKQELWITQNRHRFGGQTVFIGVGGSLDVWSGQSQRAPAWMRAINLEWLYRITSEPWRIQRIAKTLPLFVIKVWVHFFSRLFQRQ